MKNDLTRLWFQLHRQAVEYPVKPSETEKAKLLEWLDDWTKQFPEHCPCLDEYREAVKISEPPTDGKESFFWWTVALHDRVNMLLNKGLFSQRSLEHPLLEQFKGQEQKRFHTKTKRRVKKCGKKCRRKKQ